MHPAIRRQTLGDLLQRSAARAPTKLAIACGDVRWSYAEFDALCTRLAAGLAQRGIAKGTRVAVLARNSHAFAALRFALARLGAVLVPINFMLKADEVAYILRHAGATMLATDSGLGALARAAAALDTAVRAVRLAAVGGSRPTPEPGMTAFDALAACDATPARAGAGRQRPAADRLHQRHRVAAQGRDADARRGAVAVRQLPGRCRHRRATT